MNLKKLTEIIHQTHNEPLVEYALSGMSNQLFISKYQFALPDENDLKHFLEKILREEPGVN